MGRRDKHGRPSKAPTYIKLTKASVKAARPDQERRVLLHDDELHGFCLSIECSGHKSFKLIYSHHGRKRWYTIGAADVLTVKEARERARLVHADAILGGDPQGKRSTMARAPSFAQLVSDYLSDPPVADKKKSLPNIQRILERHLLPVWGTLSLPTITGSDACDRHAVLSNRNGKFAANRALSAASGVFSWALSKQSRREKYQVSVNPCKEVSYHKTNVRSRHLESHELMQLFSVVDTYEPSVAATLKLLIYTGQRINEVACMRWEDINGKVWKLAGQESGSWCGTKNKMDHVVWLSEPARQILNALDPRAIGRVFDRRAGTLCTYVRSAMTDISERFKWPPATPHDLRRTHGTIIIDLRFGRDAMNRIQNHADGGIADVYDQHDYLRDFEMIQEAVAAEILKRISPTLSSAA